ncbi:MAG: nucleoside triphosphate pyrophosphohydrolase [Planctomycetes bacterium]|nr:nucleoside triphosphate pyrophosphohydrolase [Planctomycetota bacterium]
MTPTSAFAKLLRVQRRLLAPGGCPWDRKQTARDLKTYVLEEAYEVLHAIDVGDPEELCEELGDLAYQILFLAAMAESGKCRPKGQPGGRAARAAPSPSIPFTIADVFSRAADKLVRRHPHVFGNGRARTADQVLTNWERLKAAERREKGGQDASILDGVPPTLPALLAAYRLTGKAARVGFDWERDSDVAKKVGEEARELAEALRSGRRQRIRDEFGDILFVLANVARRLELDPEEALQKTNAKFIRRFQFIERTLARQGRRCDQASLKEMDALWDEAKAREGGRIRRNAGGGRRKNLSRNRLLSRNGRPSLRRRLAAAPRVAE